MVGGYSRSSRWGLCFTGSDSVRGLRLNRLTILAVIAGLASLVVAPLSPALTALVHGVSVIGIAALLIWGPRRHEPLVRTRWLLVGALGAVLVSELMIVVFQLIAGHAPTSPWAGDYVAFLYTPLTIAGLLLVPTPRGGNDHRMRALCDGLFAAGSLWFLVAAVASHARRGPGSDTPTGTI